MISCSPRQPILQVLAALPRWILSTRTTFSSFLAQSFRIQRRDDVTPASAVFPLPLADFGLFVSSGPNLSKRRWRTLLWKRMRHLIIVALNFLHGGVTHCQLGLLGRGPNAVQSQVHSRLWALMTACDTPGANHSLVPGRSGPEFIARLPELEHFAQFNNLLSTDHYGGGPEDLELKKVGKAPVDERNLPIAPYSSLNADRLKLVGRANWKIEDFLEDELWLPFIEPKILQRHKEIDRSLGPNLEREDRSENLKIAKKWADQSLLALVAEPPHQDAFARIFNAYKSPEHDRQIGDRRLANMTERHVARPSKHLPIGYMLAGIYVPPGCLLRGAVTDRKDFYHQALATFEKAATSVLPFSYPIDEFYGTEAYDELIERLRGPQGRLKVGDKLQKGMTAKTHKKKRRGVLCSPPDSVYPAFKSLLQGDHLGVEVALSGHVTLLERAGLLSASCRIQGWAPISLQ